ncbi:MAG: hypothetical protein WBX38_05635 [Candidatus Sulfotelmatobacter sp.]
MLDLDYASTVAHFDAMMACRALKNEDDAAKHEKVLNALLDSIAKDGDGKTSETSYLAVTTQEEYIFMVLRLNVKASEQSLVTQNGHSYDRLKVFDPKANTTQYLWFNADIQMNPQGLPAPSPTGSPKDSAAPVVIATARRTAPARPDPNTAEVQGQSALSRTLSALSRTLYDQEGVSVVATETQDTLEITVSEPDPILVSLEVDRNQNGQFDRLVDVAYRPQSEGNPCAQYLIDETHNTACGSFASSTRLKDFKDDEGRRQFKLILAKKELSFEHSSAKLVLVLRNQAQRRTTYYPPERFQKAIDVPYVLMGTPIKPDPSVGQAVKQYTPVEDVVWSRPMKIGVMRMLSGNKCHFVVNFTVPDPTIIPNSPRSDPINRITVYGSQIQNGSRIDLPSDIVPPIVGDWKPGDPVRLEFDLPREYADPSPGWNLRFCIGNSSSCMPSSNLLVDSADAPTSTVVDPRTIANCKGKSGKDMFSNIPVGFLAALHAASKKGDWSEVIRIASQPESGLRVASVSRGVGGHVIGYMIVNAEGCMVSTMHSVE